VVETLVVVAEPEPDSEAAAVMPEAEH